MINKKNLHNLRYYLIHAVGALVFMMACMFHHELRAEQDTPDTANTNDHQSNSVIQPQEGRPEDQFLLGVACMEGKGVKQDFEKAGYWFRKAADQGDAKAMNALGALYSDGKGTSQDYKVANEWFEKSAKMGEPRAFYNLARMQEKGLGTTRNIDKAIDCYKKASDLGFLRAKIKLGEIYYFGDLGIKEDYSKAFPYFVDAAKYGDPDAENFLGTMYLQGLGTKADQEKARYWYLQAAHKGLARAQTNVGNLYIHKNSTKEDYRKAVVWITFAIANGDANAQTHLLELTSVIPADSMAKGKSDAAEMKARGLNCPPE
jgi:TPR repeat protein